MCVSTLQHACAVNMGNGNEKIKMKWDAYVQNGPFCSSPVQLPFITRSPPVVFFKRVPVVRIERWNFFLTPTVLLASGASPTLIVQLRKIFVIYIYIYMFYIYIYIYIYIYTFVRRARAVHARATRKRRTGRLRFNGQYNRLKNGYFSSKL